MIISVVVCTRDRPEHIGDCLQALMASWSVDLEVIVVDQSSGTETARLVAAMAREDARIRLVSTNTVGLSRARNIGIRQSNGDIIAFTDDDCVPSCDWPAAVVREFRRHPEISGIFGRCLAHNPPFPGERPLGVKTDDRRRVFSGRSNPWRLGHGSNMAFRRDVFDRAGYFDELLGPGGELSNCDDADFAYRALRSGLKLMYSPEPVIYHKQFRHGEKLWRLEEDYGIGAGALYSKHLRCGDPYVLLLIADRWIRAGAAHMVYGLLTGRRSHMRLGWYRIAYSAIGFWTARRFNINAKGKVFTRPRIGEQQDERQPTGIGSHLHP